MQVIKLMCKEICDNHINPSSQHPNIIALASIYILKKTNIETIQTAYNSVLQHLPPESILWLFLLIYCQNWILGKKKSNLYNTQVLVFVFALFEIWDQSEFDLSFVV